MKLNVLHYHLRISHIKLIILKYLYSFAHKVSVLTQMEIFVEEAIQIPRDNLGGGGTGQCHEISQEDQPKCR
jgi:hypothetical protein